MRYIAAKYILGMFIFLTLMQACKIDLCDSIVCGNEGTCVNGVCTYPEQYICGTHMHWTGSACECDTGWIGYRCEMRSELLVGRYHVTGEYSSWINGSGSSSHSDEIIEVLLDKDTLTTRGYKFILRSNCNPNSYCFYSGNQVDYSYLTFYAQDSIYFYRRAGGIGSFIQTELNGVKL